MIKTAEKRRHPSARQSIKFPMIWPKPAAERRDILRTWHGIAMRAIHQDDGSFRLLAALPFAMDWEKGAVFLTDVELTELCGGCGSRTISRDIGYYREAGLIQTETVWIDKHGDGKKIKSRKISLSIPLELRELV